MNDKCSLEQFPGLVRMSARSHGSVSNESNAFEEKTSDVRWIPHSRDGYVICNFVKNDGKYSIYQPFDDSELFNQSPQDDSNLKRRRKAIKIPTSKVKKHGMKIEMWEYMDQFADNVLHLPEMYPPYILHNIKARFVNNQIYVKCPYIL